MIRVCFLHAKSDYCRPTGWWLKTKSKAEFFGGVSPEMSYCGHYAARLSVGRPQSFEFSSVDWSHFETSISVEPCKIVADEGLPVLKATKYSEDEIILLLTICGEENEIFEEISVVDGEILREWKSYIHGCPVAHVVARLNSEDGHVAVRIRRYNNGKEVAIFSWQCKQFILGIKEYKKAIGDNSLLKGRSTIEQEMKDCRARQLMREHSRTYRKLLAGTDQLRKLSAALNLIDKQRSYEMQDETLFFIKDKNTGRRTAHYYNEVNILRLERRVEKLKRETASTMMIGA